MINAKDKVIELEAPLPEDLPEACPICGSAWSFDTEEATTIDLPEFIAREIKRWNIQIAACTCGFRQRGTHPELGKDQHGATAHRVGPRIQAAGLALHYHYGMAQELVKIGP